MKVHECNMKVAFKVQVSVTTLVKNESKCLRKAQYPRLRTDPSTFSIYFLVGTSFLQCFLPEKVE